MSCVIYQSFRNTVFRIFVCEYVDSTSNVVFNVVCCSVRLVKTSAELCLLV